MDYELLKRINPSLYDDKELIELRNNLEIEYGKLNETWAEDAALMVDESFDPYSFVGEKKIKKFTKRYADQASDILVTIDLIDDEIAKREKYKEEQRYSGTSKFSYSDESMEEFIEKESNKTLLHRQDVVDDKN